jgi:hypothetical protein
MTRHRGDQREIDATVRDLEIQWLKDPEAIGDVETPTTYILSLFEWLASD